MKRMLAALGLTAVVCGACAVPAQAALPVGAAAPDFTVPATLGGHEFSFKLADALKKGPVVLYFYPQAFTGGCTAEAHAFAAAIDQYKAMHATVIGVSHDEIAKLDRFSVSECQSKFPVAADPTLMVAKSYDAKMALVGYAARTSYVIAPDGRVIYAYSNMNPGDHVANTLAAVKAYEAKHG
ncbi:peroxiredoxin [Caulobacter sp. S45]|uniref:peroxiredoxin n=1 Tax=Caulobacter sp. S45 TaxID=1641861 RepID=UPI0015766501|nr:peroxiredoxin [Caulobacter sp. S45]